MQTAQTFLGQGVDPLVVGRGRFPAHAADQADCFHFSPVTVVWLDGGFWRPSANRIMPVCPGLCEGGAGGSVVCAAILRVGRDTNRLKWFQLIYG